GASKVVDEACLPVKVFYGHVAELAGRELDYIFVPRLVSIEKGSYICPKIIGIPDMVKANIPAKSDFLSPNLNMRAKENHHQFLKEIAELMGENFNRVQKAWRSAMKVQQKYELDLLQGIYPEEVFFKSETLDNSGDLNILLLGHEYNLYDDYINMGIRNKLKQMGCNLITSNQVPKYVQQVESRVLSKRMFWTYGKSLLGTARYFREMPGNKGVVILTSFGCGIDSIVGNMIIRYLGKMKIPYLNITLDEHTGEAGINTRIEAFLDLLRWRREIDENNISAYGEYLGNHQRYAGIYGS
ncbi:MAG: acyl-CoA dehydratase activase-related protein, partial [Bacillota bacterium]